MTNRGFTLLEMAIVMLLIGLLTGGMVSAYQEYREVRHHSDTRQALKIVERALLGYALLHQGRLPSADTDCDGRSDGGTVGSLPWQTLGLDSDLGRDGWKRVFRYRVDSAFRDDGTPLSALETRDGMRIFSVRGNGSTDRLLTDADPRAPVALVLSLGNTSSMPECLPLADWGTIDLPERSSENADADALYLLDVDRRLPSGQPVSDDQLRWISPYRLAETLLDGGIADPSWFSHP